jgi:hypothetical protein
MTGNAIARAKKYDNPHRRCQLPAANSPARAQDYSSIFSAVTSSEFGILRPSVFAVLPLITSSKVVGCSTGRSPRFGE